MWLSLPLGDSVTIRRASVLARCTGVAGVLIGVGMQGEGGMAGLAGGALAAALLAGALLGWVIWRLGIRAGLFASVFTGRGATLLVDTDGSAFLRPAAGGLIALEVRHAHCGLGIAWIAAVGEGHRYSLLSGADRVDDAQWRRVCAWVQWRARGG